MFCVFDNAKIAAFGSSYIDCRTPAGAAEGSGRDRTIF